MYMYIYHTTYKLLLSRKLEYDQNKFRSWEIQFILFEDSKNIQEFCHASGSLLETLVILSLSIYQKCLLTEIYGEWNDKEYICTYTLFL